MRRMLLALLVPCLTLTACAGSGGAAPQTTGAGSPTESTSSPASTPERTGQAEEAEQPEALLARAESLFAARVSRSGSTRTVTSWWGVACGRRGCRPTVMAQSSDDFATATYRVGPFGRISRDFQGPRLPGAPDLGDCATSVDAVTLCWGPDGVSETGDGGRTWSTRAVPFDEEGLISPVVSLAPGVHGLVGGGDGATLLPFAHTARVAGSDGADPVVRPVRWPHGEMAYVSGEVVLSDGRLLALLADWSDDRRRRPSDRHHGLWASAGDGWSSYTPVEPLFTPALTPRPHGYSPLRELAASADPDPVIWVLTWDDRLYVSTDDAATFSEVATR